MMVLEVGMRARLTRNLDKERGFVNGNVGTVVKVLKPEVFIIETVQGKASASWCTRSLTMERLSCLSCKNVVVLL